MGVEPRLSKHNASGPLYGYLFQFDRALYWLACQKRGTKVGIETEDDVVSIDAEGQTIREQDKCSISNTNYPLSDRSVDLWKTLKIWVDAIEADEVNLHKTQFHLITNNRRPECFAKQMGRAENEESINLCVETLRDLGKNPSDSIKDYVESVLGCDDKILREMMRRIYFSDLDTTDEDNLRESIASYLHIPETLPSDEIINELLGWMISRAKELWLNGKPAWITREELDEYYFNMCSRFKSRRFIETAKKDLVPRIYVNHKDHKDRTFVRQLSLLDIDDDYTIDAIIDFLCCSDERIRIAEKGFVTKDQFDNFNNNLVERWKAIFMRNSHNEMHHDISKGISIYTETLDHREPLAGQSTEEYYLTKGYLPSACGHIRCWMAP